MADHGPIRLLLIEDDPDDALLVRSALAQAPEETIEVEWLPRLDSGLERLAKPFTPQELARRVRQALDAEVPRRA